MRELDIFNSEPRYVICIDKYDTPNDTTNYQKLEIGKTYFMTDIVVSGWHTDIWLDGFSSGWNDSFNSVLFGEVDD
jgi:hypothetical protein